MKRFLYSIFLVSSICMGMGSVSAFAAGDVARGLEISKSCRACHGETGRSSSQAFPIIGGQHEKYIQLALAAYKDLASPWKELLAYYNQSQDMSLRWDTITERFAPAGMIDEALFDVAAAEMADLMGEHSE